MKIQAQEIYDKYFKVAQAQPRGVVAKLGNIVAQIERACQKQHTNYKDGGAWREILKVSNYQCFKKSLLKPLISFFFFCFSLVCVR